MRTGEESSLSGVAAWISSKSSPSSSLCHLFEIESGGMPLLDTLPSHLRMFPASPECFRSQPPKAAEFISPARQRWEKIVFGREAPEGRHPIKSAFVADPPASSGSVTPTIAFTLTRAVFQRCLEPRPRTSARRPCAGHPLRRFLQIEIANQTVQIIRMHAQTLRGLRATAFRFFQSTLNQALL